MGKRMKEVRGIRMAGRRAIGLVLLSVALTAPVQAAEESGNMLRDFQPGSISSAEQADRTLAEAGRERAAIEARYAAEEGECFPRFFATSCIDAAKERRRKSLAQLRSIEQEANTFKRRARVAERDAALQERAQAATAKQQQSNGATAPPAGTTGITPAGAGTENPAALPPETKKPAPQRRRAAHARVKEQEADEASEARKREANVAAYERKVKEAQERQREVEERKLEKARQREARAAASQAAPN